jgi:hypothetical protein
MYVYNYRLFDRDYQAAVSCAVLTWTERPDAELVIEQCDAAPCLIE